MTVFYDAKVSRSFGVTLSLGNFEFARVDVGMEVGVPEGMTTEDVIEELESRLLDDLDDAVENVLSHLDSEDDDE